MTEEIKPRFKVIAANSSMNGISYTIADALHPDKDFYHPDLLTTHNKHSANTVCDILNAWYAKPKLERKPYT